MHATFVAALDVGQVFSAGVWILLAAVLAVAGLYSAKWVKSWSQRGAEPAAFNLQSLREMLARGDISEAEFQRLKRQLTASMRIDEPPRGESEPAAGTDAEN